MSGVSRCPPRPWAAAAKSTPAGSDPAEFGNWWLAWLASRANHAIARRPGLVLGCDAGCGVLSVSWDEVLSGDDVVSGAGVSSD
jgi:hypothetical protein